MVDVAAGETSTCGRGGWWDLSAEQDKEKLIFPLFCFADQGKTKQKRGCIIFQRLKRNPKD